MEKHIIDEKTDISYILQGDYYISNLTLSDEDKTIKIGIWSIHHKRYLLEHKKEVVTIIQMNGTLQAYLADINEQVEVMYIRLINVWKKLKA